MKSAKQLLASGEPIPDGVSPEDLPAAMEPSEWGHGDGYIPKDFLRITPLCKAGRRALWMRAPPASEPAEDSEDLTLVQGFEDGSLVELKAGREGDDAHFILREGDAVTRETVHQLVDLLLTVKSGLEM